jgi:hypothetical protein
VGRRSAPDFLGLRRENRIVQLPIMPPPLGAPSQVFHWSAGRRALSLDHGVLFQSGPERPFEMGGSRWVRSASCS